jgi:tryptophan aminotransferase
MVLTSVFQRFKLLLPVHAEDDSESVIRSTAFSKGVLALPGTVFLPDGRCTAYVRASFSLNESDEVEEACRRLAQAIKQVHGEAP